MSNNKNVINWRVLLKLMNSFPGSFINHNGEFIADRKSNTYFILWDCKSEFDIKCKVLEWCSRAATKMQPYSSNKKNAAFNAFMLGGINCFLGTNFTHDDMEQIYTYLGNACHHTRTIAFVESGYDMTILKEETK